MVIDAKEDRKALLKQYAVGSATMIEAKVLVLEALGYEDVALELKGQAKVIRQGSSDELEAALKKGNKLLAQSNKLLANSNHEGALAQSVYNKHFALTSVARDRQYNLLLTRAIPEIVVLVEASMDASTIQKAALIAESDRYITVIKDFKKIDEEEKAVDAVAKTYNLAVKRRKDYKIDDAVKKAMPSGGGLVKGLTF